MHSNQNFLIISFLFLIISTSCNNTDKDVNRISNKMCECGEPVVAWKNSLKADPMNLEKGHGIRMEAAECLREENNLVKERYEDEEFRNAIKERVKDKCPSMLGSTDPFLRMMAGKPISSPD